MAIVYGLTDFGLVVKNRIVIREDINSAIRLLFGNSFNLTDRSIAGVLVGILADRIGEVWELLEQVASSQDPNKAAKSLLDAISLITGTLRPVAQPSKVDLYLTGLSGVVVPAASEFATASTFKAFRTTSSATLVGAGLWLALTAYTIGDFVTNSGNVYLCTQTGTSAASGGPTGTAPEFTPDGTVLWTYLGVGAAQILAKAESVDLGIIIATARDISLINTFIGGLQSVTNLADAVVGRLVAEDGELRLLRTAELGTAGSSPFDALRAHLLELSGVTSVTLFPNNTDLTDADGVPPHSVEALVRGGVDQDIWDELLKSVAAGIGTHGNTSGFSIDSQNTLQAQSFSRPQILPIYVVMVVSIDTLVYPVDGNSQIANAIVTYGVSQPNGRDVVPSVISAQPFKAGIQGVLDVTSTLVFTDVIGTPTAWTTSHGYVNTTGSRSVVTNDGGRTYICTTGGTSSASPGGPTGTGTAITDGSVVWRFLGAPIVITSRQLADYILANISITSVPGTP
jgi:hypothetical protein